MQSLSLHLALPHSLRRQLLEACIVEKFADCYGAHLQHFLPYLLSLRSADQPAAIVGIQPAHQGRLFVEGYFQQPVEQATCELFRTPVDRDQIVEIGNLVATIPGAVYFLFAALADTLHQAGFRWVICTATPQIASLLETLGFPSRTLCRARQTPATEVTGNWGNYYASDPCVIVGDVRVAAARVADNPQLSAVSRQLALPISAIAASLKTSPQ